MNETIPYIIDIIGRLTKEDIYILYDNFKQSYHPQNQIIISPKFFTTSLCKKCLSCCNKVNTHFVLDEIDEHTEENFKPIELEIHTDNYTKSVELYSYKNKEQCFYLQKDGSCKIHDKKPLQCAVHPVHIDIIKDRLYIHKRQYQRNYRFGCQMCFDKYNFHEYNKDICFFQRLLKMANKLAISTYIPDILQVLMNIKVNDDLTLSNIPIININLK